VSVETLISRLSARPDRGQHRVELLGIVPKAAPPPAHVIERRAAFAVDG
jgi:hypothetical protein